MKRLIKKADEFSDDFLGKRIEIVYNKSKFFGYVGNVDSSVRSGEKYRVFLEPQPFEQNQNIHTIYVKKTDAFKWFKIINEE